MRSSASNLQLLPPIKPITGEERAYESNLQRAYHQRLEQQEREIDAAISALDQLGRQRSKLDSHIHTTLLEIEEVETSMKVFIGIHVKFH